MQPPYSHNLLGTKSTRGISYARVTGRLVADSLGYGELVEKQIEKIDLEMAIIRNHSVIPTQPAPAIAIDRPNTLYPSYGATTTPAPTPPAYATP